METLLCKLKGVPNQIILCVQNFSYPKRQTQRCNSVGHIHG